MTQVIKLLTEAAVTAIREELEQSVAADRAAVEQIATDFTGWVPVFSIANDSLRRVLRVTDWVGGYGAKPVTGQYVGATGLVPLIADAIDVRGVQGIQGIQGVQGIQGIPGIQGAKGDNQVPLGPWNASTNSPALTADASAAVVGSYYDVTVAGVSAFAGNNFASGQAFAVGDRIAKLNNQWYRIPSTDLALQTILKLAPSDMATPPSNTVSVINDLTSFTTNNNYTVNGWTFIVTSPLHGRALNAGYVSKFRIALNNADATRLVRFYILTEVSAGSYQVKYDSGPQSLTAAGINTFTPTLGSVAIMANDVIGAHVLASSTANTFAYFSSGGPSVSAGLYQSVALTLGNSYSTNSTNAGFRLAIEATIVDPTLLVARYWGGKSNGYPEIEQAIADNAIACSISG